MDPPTSVRPVRVAGASGGAAGIRAARETPDVETASEAYAARFSGQAGRYLLDRQEAALRAVLDGGSGESILDVGGGHAQLIPILSGPGRFVVVLGSAPSALGRVRAAHPETPAVTGDLLALPFADRSVDVVTAVRLISHVDAWPRLVAELCRVARKSVVIDYPPSTGFNLLTPLLFGVKKRVEGNTRPYRTFSRRELAVAFGAHSFEIGRTRPQLFVPMVVHRRLGSPAPLRAFERGAEAAGLTRLLGSPVILRADRRPGPA